MQLCLLRSQGNGGLTTMNKKGRNHDALHLPNARNLGSVLMVPTMTPSLQQDLALHSCTLTPLGSGYARMDGTPYRAFVVFLDEVAAAERDDLIGCISHRRITKTESAEWLLRRGGIPEALAMAKIAGFSKAFLKKLAADKEIQAAVVKDAPVRVRLSGLRAKERFAGLSAKELKELAKSRQVLRAMQSLPVAARRRIAASLTTGAGR